MKKKTNRTMKLALSGILLFSLGTAMQSKEAVLVDTAVANNNGNMLAKIYERVDITKDAIKLMSEFRDLAQDRNFFRIFNNMRDFCELDELSAQVIKENPRVGQEIENLDVRISKKQVPHGMSRTIPMNNQGVYNLQIAALRGSIPYILVSMPSDTRLKAMILKMFTMSIGRCISIDLSYDFRYDGRFEEEYVGNLLAEHDEFRQLVIALGRGAWRDALKVCKNVWFQWPFNFHISLPESTLSAQG